MATGGRRRGGPSRPKAKKKRTKYLSLSRIIVKAEVQTPPEDGGPWVKKEEDGQQQADPFALHHEASTLFAAFPAPSLSDILGASAGSPSPSPSASPDRVSGGAGAQAAEEQDLARRALRGRERWVYCRSSSPSTPTATSSASPCSSAASTGASASSLLLKLDYQEILAAWADRGSLYIGAAAPKREPEPDLDNVLVETEPPRPQQQEAAGAERAERVRRYKEKRLNRLFAKRIRYEVRRVNAVRRPRFKGRFIKEHEEIEVEPT